MKRPTGLSRRDGGCSRKSRMSLPLVKQASPPVISTTRTAVSACASSTASAIRLYIARVSAFFLSWRSRRRVSSPASRSTNQLAHRHSGMRRGAAAMAARHRHRAASGVGQGTGPPGSGYAVRRPGRDAGRSVRHWRVGRRVRPCCAAEQGGDRQGRGQLRRRHQVDAHLRMTPGQLRQLARQVVVARQVQQLDRRLVFRAQGLAKYPQSGASPVPAAISNSGRSCQSGS